MVPIYSDTNPSPPLAPVHDNDFGDSAGLDHVESSYAEDWQPSLLVDDDRVLSSQQHELDGDEYRLYFDGSGDDPSAIQGAGDAEDDDHIDPDRAKVRSLSYNSPCSNLPDTLSRRSWRLR